MNVSSLMVSSPRRSLNLPKDAIINPQAMGVTIRFANRRFFETMNIWDSIRLIAPAKAPYMR